MYKEKCFQGKAIFIGKKSHPSGSAHVTSYKEHINWLEIVIAVAISVGLLSSIYVLLKLARKIHLCCKNKRTRVSMPWYDEPFPHRVGFAESVPNCNQLTKFSGKLIIMSDVLFTFNITKLQTLQMRDCVREFHLDCHMCLHLYTV